MKHSKVRRLKFASFGFLMVFGVFGLSAHCSLTASPGDYTSGLRAPPDAGSPTHVAVIAGERDLLDPSEITGAPASDVWTATLDGYGSIVGWTVGPSSPFSGNAGQTLVMGGNLYVVAKPAARDAQQTGIAWIATTDQGLAPAWSGTFAEVPAYSDQGFLLLPPGLVTLGGLIFGVSDGSFVSTYYPDVWFASFSETSKTFAARAAAPSTLATPRSSVTPVVYGKFIYAIGGITDEDLSGSPIVEVAMLGDKLEPFVATTPIQNPAAQKPYKAKNFAACAGEGTLYIVGGEVLGASDVVVMSRIDESNGHLSNWQSTSTLPGGRSGAGCFVAHHRLYVLGGKQATSRTAEVLSAKILPDGSLEPWESKPHAPMPAPRSQIAVAAY